jgi:hypothetical protein
MIEVTGFCDSGHDAQCAPVASSADFVVRTVMHAVTRTPELHFLIGLKE